jgi:hypothetical protein
MALHTQDELAKLDAELDARHAQELAALDAAPPAPAAAAPVAAATAKQGAAAADGSAAAADRASKYLKDLSVAAADDEEGDDDDDAAGGGGKSKVCVVRTAAGVLAVRCDAGMLWRALESVPTSTQCVVAVAAAAALAATQKLTKAQKRREKAAAKDAEREARIAAGVFERVSRERRCQA